MAELAPFIGVTQIHVGVKLKNPDFSAVKKQVNGCIGHRMLASQQNRGGVAAHGVLHSVAGKLDCVYKTAVYGNRVCGMDAQTSRIPVPLHQSFKLAGGLDDGLRPFFCPSHVGDSLLQGERYDMKCRVLGFCVGKL